MRVVADDDERRAGAAGSRRQIVEQRIDAFPPKAGADEEHDRLVGGDPELGADGRRRRPRAAPDGSAATSTP